ncbi:MAG TPA: YfhO family protein [Anaerolineaceae bacterium]|nr:YfhO family protein [Anaerolineaceae bacterium]HPN50305.1 YfhO family protein [Anaerolineaceae bacterium]
MKKSFFIILIIPLILYLFPGQVAFFAGSAHSDLLISHYPNAEVIRQALSAGQFPLWANNILSGYPFHANPLSGLWYLPGWLALLLPLPWGFNLVMLLHLLWGGMGVFFWLKQEGLKPAAALLAGVMFELLPSTAAHFGAGHVTLIYALAWTPWLLWSEKKWQRTHSWRFWQWPAVMLGAILLADVRWAFYAGVLWAGVLWFDQVRALNLVTGKLPKGVLRAGFWVVFAVQKITGLTIQVLLACGLAAPLLLPLWQYAGLSTRSLMTGNDVLTLSMPPLRLLGGFLPLAGGSAEWVFYGGAVAVSIACLMILSPGLLKRGWFWLALSLLGVVLALGENLPFASSLTGLPVVSWLRVPPRWLMISGLAACATAAWGLDALLEENPQDIFKVWVRPTLGQFTLAVLGLALAGGLMALNGTWDWGLMWGGLGLMAAALLVSLRWGGKIKVKAFTWAVLGVLVIQLGGINLAMLEGRPVDEVLAEGKAVAQAVKTDDLSRVVSLSYAIPQQTAVQAGLQLADGIDPMQMAAYAAYLGQALGTGSEGYSVTLPPFVSGNPETDNAGAAPDAKKLGLLNIVYVTAAFDLPESSGLVLEQVIGNVRIYKNPEARSRAWLTRLDGSIIPAAVQSWAPGRVQLAAEGPGLLTLSEMNYPGWEVSVDGKQGVLERVNDVLMGVNLSEGLHEVRFTFQSPNLAWGWGLWGGSAAILFLWGFRRWKKAKR